MNVGGALKRLATSWDDAVAWRLAAYDAGHDSFVLHRVETIRKTMVSRSRDGSLPDLHTQLEDLFVEVWRQESFERTHPLTCDAIRAASGR